MTPRLYLRSISVACILSGWMTILGQDVTLTVTSPEQVTISKPLSSGKDNGKGNDKIKVHKDLPPRGGPASQSDGALQTNLGPFINASGGTHFDGIPANGAAPSDVNMAVGQNPAYSYILQTVNSRYAIFTKSGAVVVGPNSLSSLWAPLGSSNGCATNNSGDVVAQYDKIADRWIVTQLGGSSAPFSECIAISTTADPTGTYYLYSFAYGTILNDYPKFGVWPTATNSAYLATYNLFANGANFTGGQVCAYDRAKMLAGDPTAQSICYTINGDGGYLPSDLDGSTPPLNGTPGYFATFETLSSLRLYALAPNFASPASSTLTRITPDLNVTPFAEACGGGACIPQSGTTTQLDSLGDRLMYRLAFRNYGDHEAMVVNHAVNTGSTVGERWYELRSPVSTTAAFSVYQQSTFSPDSTYRWMGSAAMDGVGDIALGYSVSSSSINPGIRYTGRTPAEALGTMETEATIISGTGSQTGGLTRWGDYTALRIDPADDCTFWYTNQYLSANGSFNWRTHIGSFKFTSCGAGGTVAAPTFTPPAGNYSSAQAVTISSTTAGASIRYTTDGSTPSSTVGTVYSGPVSVGTSLTLKAIAYKTGMTDSTVSSASYTISGGVSNTAAFVKTDTTTQGSWKGIYGANGYNVIDDTVSYPGYVMVTPAGQSNFIWASSTSDVRALQKALSSTDRIAATWYDANTFTIDLNFTDGAQHQLAVYCLDWDTAGARKQTVSILDSATHAQLDSQSVTSFQNGKYLAWNVTGHVILQVTNAGGPNAVISGLFFDASATGSSVAAPTFNPPAGNYSSAQPVTISSTTLGASIRYTTDGSTPSSTVGTVYSGPVSVGTSLTLKAIAYKTGMTDSTVSSGSYTISGGVGNSAAFVKTDTTTQGSWKGVYGANGSNVIDDSVSYPGYVTVTPIGQSNYVWAASTSDVRGLQKALSSTDRIAATWYTLGTFTIDLNFTDGAQHQLAVYCLDWDTAGARKQTVSILDGATNAQLDSQSVTSFQNGKYVVWNLKGHVILQVTNAGGANAVISGLFFDSPNAASNSAAFVKTDTTTQGSWKGVYGVNGYNVIDDTVSYPGYVTVTPAGQSNFIWANSTSDVRGLQKALSSTDRIAATWYDAGTFTVDLNFTDGAQHQLAVYCLDWDTGGARKQAVSILDGATHAQLDSQSVTSFQNGKYLVWNVKGHVILQVTNAGGANAVISGLFF